MERQYIDMVHEIYPSLSKKEKLVADYVIQNMTNVLRMSSRELKDAVNVSEPTVFRFCQALGFTGFSDFKISMAQQVTSYMDYFLTDESSETKLQTLIRRTLESEIKIIDTTIRMIDYKLLEKTAKRVLNARRICLYGTGSSAESCNDARRKFSRLGINAWSYSEINEVLSILGTFDKQDMLIAVSHSGTTQDIENVLRFAFNRKIYTVLLTAYPNTRMVQYVNTVLRTYAREIVDKLIAGASRISQFAMMDALFIAVGSLLRNSELQSVEQTLHEIKEILK